MFTSPPSSEPAAAERRGSAGRAAPNRTGTGIDAGTVVGQVSALRDKLSRLRDQQVLEALGAVQQALNALEGARAALVHEVTCRELHVGRGETSAAETLTSLAALRRSAARQVERESAVIAEKAEVAEAHCDGSITTDQASALASAEVPETVRDELLIDAMRQNADQTRRKVRQAEAAHRAESDAQQRNRQQAARRASMWIDDDGMWNLLAKLDPETGDQVKRLLERAVQREWRSEEDQPATQQRTVPQRAADALVALLRGPRGASSGPASGNPESVHSQQAGSSQDEVGLGPLAFNDPNAQMIVTVELASLRSAISAVGGCACADKVHGLDRSERHDAGGPISSCTCTCTSGPTGRCTCASRPTGRCTCASGPTGLDTCTSGGKICGLTDTGTELSPSDLRRIACDATIIPAVMGTRSEVLDVGRTSRTIPPAIRRALIVRDGGCVWPGCGVAPIGCVGHHLVHWADLGPTSLANLALLCRTHHKFLHQHDLGLLPPGAPSQRTGAIGLLDDASPPLTAREERAGRWTVTGLSTNLAADPEILLPLRC